MSNSHPAQLFGRDTELANIRGLLAQEGVRCLTLTGPGGTGKTRLAEAVASDLRGHPKSAYFVDLSVVDDAAAVPASIAQSLGVQESGSESLVGILRRVLAEGVGLVVLDNFERVMDAATLVSDLLGASGGLKFLVTSREPLHIRAETVLPVAPLPVPEPDATDLVAILALPSVRLFQDRGQRRKPDFVVNDTNVLAVGEICRKLDGLPLAIELAAAQIGVLSPSTILARLRAHEPFVLGRAPDLPARHRTLSATVAWSYDLLNPGEQLVFRRCGVFTGSFGLRAAAAMVRTEKGVRPDLLATLAQLADKSLVQPADAASEEPRFRLLETIRTFCIGLTDQSDELLELRHRHLAFYAEMAEEAERLLVGPAMGSTLDRLERDYDNFRAALSWSLDSSDTGDLIAGLRLAGALHRFWMMRGRLGEARQWLERGLGRDGEVPVAVRAKALNALGVLIGMQGDSVAAEACFRESFGLWEALNDPVRMAVAIGNIGLAVQDRRDVDQATVCFQQAEALYAKGGDRRGVAVSIGSRAHLTRQEGHPREALELFQQALSVFREEGDPRGTANSLANLGHVLVMLGRPQDATAHFREALELRRSLGNTLGVAECLEGFAVAAVFRRQSRRAARLLGAAAAMREITGASLPATDRDYFSLVVQRIHQQLDPETFAAEESNGRASGFEEAIAYALQEEHRRSPDSGLTERERQVAELVARGLTNPQIATALQLSRRTVGTHLEHMFAKLGFQGRAELAAWIARHPASERAPSVSRQRSVS